MELWTLANFRLHYPSTSSINDAVCTTALTDAELEVENYVTAASWADAILVSPTDARAAAKFTRVVGQLAYFYLQGQQLASGARSKHSERYRGVVWFEDEYKTSSAEASLDSEEDILSQLLEWKDTTATPVVDLTVSVSWGTGRFAIGELVVEEDE